jgi:hypothetical protein
VTEVPIESLPTELRIMALGLAAEKDPPAADVISALAIEDSKEDAGVPPIEAPEEWATSAADAARYANWLRVASGSKGEAIAIRELREELSLNYVPPDKIEREIERIRRLVTLH